MTFHAEYAKRSYAFEPELDSPSSGAKGLIAPMTDLHLKLPIASFLLQLFGKSRTCSCSRGQINTWLHKRSLRQSWKSAMTSGDSRTTRRRRQSLSHRQVTDFFGLGLVDPWFHPGGPERTECRIYLSPRLERMSQARV